MHWLVILRGCSKDNYRTSDSEWRAWKQSRSSKYSLAAL